MDARRHRGHPPVHRNGRSARILASLAMYRGGFKRREFTSLEEWWGRHLQDYYDLFSCLGLGFDRDADVQVTRVDATTHSVHATSLPARSEITVSASSIAIAKPMFSAEDADAAAVLMPMRRPAVSTSGPPEFPLLIAASV